jgi:hypothetical protein
MAEKVCDLDPELESQTMDDQRYNAMWDVGSEKELTGVALADVSDGRARDLDARCLSSLVLCVGDVVVGRRKKERVGRKVGQEKRVYTGILRLCAPRKEQWPQSGY